MFGCTFAGDGNATANIQDVTGQAGTIADGYTHDYLYGLGPDSYVDEITANGGAIFFKSQDNIGRAVSYSGLSGMYRAIHSTFIFGALRDGAFTKAMLMTQYMDYLSETVDVHEYTENTITQCTVSPNPFSNTTVVRYQMRDESPEQVSVKVYDITGRLVRQWNNPTIQQSNDIVWDGCDDNGNRLSSGTYIVRIATETETVTRAVVLMN